MAFAIDDLGAYSRQHRHKTSAAATGTSHTLHASPKDLRKPSSYPIPGSRAPLVAQNEVTAPLAKPIVFHYKQDSWKLPSDGFVRFASTADSPSQLAPRRANIPGCIGGADEPKNNDADVFTAAHQKEKPMTTDIARIRTSSRLTNPY